MVRQWFFATMFTFSAFMAHAVSSHETVEEQRITTAHQQLTDITARYQPLLNDFNSRLTGLSAAGHDHDPQAQNWLQLAADSGQQLWQHAVTDMARNHDYDDRPLYWARLQFSRELKAFAATHNWPEQRLQGALQALEKGSRGELSRHYAPTTDYRILLTGFDPFFLDRHIYQSNPSGMAALALDGWQFSVAGKNVEVRTVMVPVRFADFDHGFIEQLLTPVYAQNQADMVFTVSMGRSDFDLEHFPGRRRSAHAPDNLNVMTGATAKQPLLPSLHEQPLSGPEFVRFSLPYQAMMQVKGPYEVHDNRTVTTLEQGTFAAKDLAELNQQTAVAGTGGGYLSNEISYRAIRLRNNLHSTIPVGHIHTPRLQGFERATNAAILKQLRLLIKAAARAENTPHE